MDKLGLTPSQILDRERQISVASSEMLSILSEVESSRRSIESIMHRLEALDRGPMSTTFARNASFKSVLQFRTVKAAVASIYSALRKISVMAPKVRSASSILSDSASNSNIPS